MIALNAYQGGVRTRQMDSESEKVEEMNDVLGMVQKEIQADNICKLEI